MSATESEPTGELVPHLPPGTSVKLVGLGGIGCHAAPPLARFLSSLGSKGRLILIDGDDFEEENATRMNFSRTGNKAAVVREDLRPLTQRSNIALLAVQQYVTQENIERLINEGDILLLAVDNHHTRNLVSKRCSELANVTLISGGNDGVEALPSGKKLRGTYGNVQIYLRQNGVDVTPSLTKYHKEIAEPQDRPPTDEDCVAMAQSVPQILFTNLAAASAMLNALWLYLCGALHYGELYFDIHDGLMRPSAMPAPGQSQPQSPHVANDTGQPRSD